jgi:RHS repeat-associated protein
MLCRRWLLTGVLALVLLCAWPPRNAAAYYGVTTLDYGGELTGYAATHKDDWDPDMDAYCTWWDWHPWYGWWCYVYSQYVYGVGVQHQLTTPSGAVQQGASGSSTARFIRLDLAPHSPTEYGTWTHHGVYQAVVYEWQYWWNDWTQTYEEYYIGEWSNAFGEGWAQVVVPEPPPSISGLSPDAGPVGTLVGITGSSFGSNQGTVTFHNGVGAPVFTWTPTSIQVSVPDGAVTGPVVVTRAGGPSSTSNPTFTVTPPPASPESVHYVHLDALGSVRMITDAAGEVVGRSNFVPFGQDWEPSGVQEDRRFALLERTAETGGGSWLALDYAGARYYHSQTGRFTSPDDPIFGDPFDPQSMNLYAYALNNPLRYVDPAGTCVETDTNACVSGEDPEKARQRQREQDARAAAQRFFLESVLGTSGVWGSIPNVQLALVVPCHSGNCEGFDPSDLAPTPLGAAAASSRALARALTSAGLRRGVQQAAHHIVAAGARRAAQARKILADRGININDAVNGVFLPATKNSINLLNSAVHSTVHTVRYYSEVTARLKAASGFGETVQVLREIGDELVAGTFPR